MKRIFVLGSVNTDMVVKVDRMPMTGESMKGYGFMTNQGGKGANQAVACKKLGGKEVFFLGAVGKDAFGEELLRSLNSFGVDTRAVRTVENAKSGVCMILLDQSCNDNVLVVDTGANERVNAEEVEAFLQRNGAEGDVFITQLEVNVDAVERGLKRAKELGMYTVLNPAPARKIGAELLAFTDLIVLNETETELIADVRCESKKDMEKVYAYFSALGVKEVIVTLGAKGCYHSDGEATHCPACKVKAVDSTSAGDTFIGALSMKKARGEAIKASLPFASACSAIAVSRAGASVSIPTEEEVLALKIQ
ncbi:MAG: ribokinase [Clostridia bacterium]|nr:ribokinase [Clostridia bacterium]